MLKFPTPFQECFAAVQLSPASLEAVSNETFYFSRKMAANLLLLHSKVLFRGVMFSVCRCEVCHLKQRKAVMRTGGCTSTHSLCWVKTHFKEICLLIRA
jgi:hypothetical protein